MQKFDKNELDLILSSTIHSHRRMEELKDVYYERAMRVPGSTPRKDFQSRNRIKYYFADLEVCKSFFLFVYDVGEKRFKNLVKHYRENGRNCLFWSYFSFTKFNPVYQSTFIFLFTMKDWFHEGTGWRERADRGERLLLPMILTRLLNL